jgi:8-oxo-dGTP diphosphatase
MIQRKHIYRYYESREKQTPAEYKYCPQCQSDLVQKEIGQRIRPSCPKCGFVQYRNPAPAVALLIMDKDKILLGKRAADPGKGEWAAPSGYIEFEDDFITTAIQEAKEETGLDIQIEYIYNLISSIYSPNFHFLAIYLVARVVGGELVAGDDLVAVAWFPILGPFPKLAFQEDADALKWLSSHTPEGIPVSTEQT